MKHTLRLYRNMKDYREMYKSQPDKEIDFEFEVLPGNWGVLFGIAPRPTMIEINEALLKLGHPRDHIIIEGYDPEGQYTSLMLKEGIAP